MDDASARKAAQLLFESWQAGRRIAALPEDCRPESRSDGYAIQSAMLAASGRSPYGWKIAATSAAGQAHIGVDGPLAGRLLTGQIDASGSTVALGNTQMRVAEVEFAFTMASELAPRKKLYSLAEVLDAVESLHPAIEIPDSRYEDFAHAGAPQLIADNACAHRFVPGPAAQCEWRAIDLNEHLVDIRVEGRAPLQGKGSNVLGDPRVALAWLVNELSDAGITLAAGQVVTTGTCVAPIAVAPGDRVRADFGLIGTVEAGFAA